MSGRRNSFSNARSGTDPRDMEGYSSGAYPYNNMAQEVNSGANASNSRNSASYNRGASAVLPSAGYSRFDANTDTNDIERWLSDLNVGSRPESVVSTPSQYLRPRRSNSSSGRPSAGGGSQVSRRTDSLYGLSDGLSDDIMSESNFTSVSARQPSGGRSHRSSSTSRPRPPDNGAYNNPVPFPPFAGAPPPPAGHPSSQIRQPSLRGPPMDGLGFAGNRNMGAGGGSNRGRAPSVDRNGYSAEPRGAGGMIPAAGGSNYSASGARGPPGGGSGSVAPMAGGGGSYAPSMRSGGAPPAAYQPGSHRSTASAAAPAALSQRAPSNRGGDAAPAAYPPGSHRSTASAAAPAALSQRAPSNRGGDAAPAANPPRSHRSAADAPPFNGGQVRSSNSPSQAPAAGGSSAANPAQTTNVNDKDLLAELAEPCRRLWDDTMMQKRIKELQAKLVVERVPKTTVYLDGHTRYRTYFINGKNNLHLPTASHPLDVFISGDFTKVDLIHRLAAALSDPNSHPSDFGNKRLEFIKKSDKPILHGVNCLPGFLNKPAYLEAPDAAIVIPFEELTNH